MNAAQIKEKLLQISDTDEYFTVVLSGKKSKKVNGLYKPEEREIVLHNKNFSIDNLLMYTAIHEYAHHIHFTSPDPPKSARSHTRRFWSILHTLLIKAEELGIYHSVFEEDTRFRELTDRIKRDFLTAHGSLMKEFGRVLREAYRLCEETGTRFEDYVERVLQIDRRETTHLLRVGESGLPPEIGYENMKFLSQVKEPEERRQTLEQLQAGHTPDMLKENMARKKEDPSAGPADPQERLRREKERIEKNISKLNRRLQEIEQALAETP